MEDEKLEITIDDKFMVIKKGDEEIKLDVSDKSDMEKRDRVYYDNFIAMSMTILDEKNNI